MADPRVECPECGARVSQDPGYTAWCECGWNLQPPQEAPSRTIKERIYLNLGRRHGAALFEKVRATEAARPKASLRRFVLVLLSLGVLAATPVLVIGAVALIVLTWFNFFAFAGGLFLIAFAWFLRPRMFSIPPEQILDPGGHPRLTRLVAEVAERVGAPMPHVLAANGAANACVGVIGYGHRRGMVLGLPLLATLDDQEWVALLGHELGHLAHGDDFRARLISTALQTVGAWCEILTPTNLGEEGEGVSGILAALGTYVVSFAPRTLLTVMVHLGWSDSQLSEYHADRVAAQVAGSVDARQLIGKFLHAGKLDLAVHRVVHGQTGRTPLAEVTHLVRTLPPRERERIYRLASLEAPVLDATHPPEGLRLRMLEEQPPLPGTLVLRHADRAGIDQELAGSIARVERELVDAYQGALHGF